MAIAGVRISRQWRMTQEKNPAFLPLTGVFEPSAIQQLPDGRFLVVEDEKSHPFSLLTITADGTVESSALAPGLLQLFSSFWELDDLEGLALDRTGSVYAITSHSRDDDGDRKKSRDKLVRFRVDGKHVVEPKMVDGLRRAMTATHPVLAAAANIADVKTGGGLNIEALEISPEQHRLLIGFRSPLQGGRAIIASVDNPSEIFEADEAPRMSSHLELLDLGGHGIRSLSHIPCLGGYLVIAGPVSREQGHFKLWFWSGEPGAPPRTVTVSGLEGFERAEGVCPAVIDGKQRILIVSDDGDRKSGRCASFLLLEPDQLLIAA